MYDPNTEVGTVRDFGSDLRTASEFDQPTRKYAEGGIIDHVNGIVKATGRLEANMADFFDRLKPILRDSEPVESDLNVLFTSNESSGLTFELAAIWQRLDDMAEALTLYAGRIDL